MTLLTVKWANPAKDQKKFGSVVDMQGTRYMVKAHLVNQFQQGQTYDVPTKTEKWGENVVQIIEAFASPAPVAVAVPAPAPAPAPSAAPPPVAVPATYKAVPDVHKDRWIAFTGLVGRWVGSGNVVPSDLPTICDAVIREILRAEDQLK
jgi:hypothetical protein